MKIAMVRYRFEGAEDHARFLEYITCKGYELDLFAGGEFNKDEFILEYNSLQRGVGIFHKTKVSPDGWGNTVKNLAANNGDSPNELELWDVGGELQTLIENYISGSGDSQ